MLTPCKNYYSCTTLLARRYVHYWKRRKSYMALQANIAI